jgi:hypothetical protein
MHPFTELYPIDGVSTVHIYMTISTFAYEVRWQILYQDYTTQ